MADDTSKRPGPKAVTIDIIKNSRPHHLSPGYTFSTRYPAGRINFLGGPQIFESDGASRSSRLKN